MTEPVYLKYTFEDCVLRSEYTDQGVVWYVKFRGENEFKAKDGSNIVSEVLCIVPPPEITKEEYDNH